MKRLLLVDDDTVLIKAYRDRLAAHGFHVNTATTGTSAIATLRAGKPDLVVLDLMIPDLSGVEVLKFIRSQARLEATPVVVLTNAYLNELGRQAASIGVQKIFLKGQCSPSMLMACIDEILEPREAANPAETPGGTTPPPAPASAPPPKPGPVSPPPAPTAPVPAPASDRGHGTRTQRATPEPDAKAGAELLAQAPAICADLRKLFQSLTHPSQGASQQQLALQQMYRRVHALAAAAGLTEYGRLTQTAVVFEALLYVLIKDPPRIGPSVLRTLASLVDFVELLFRRAGEPDAGTPVSVNILVVDDDAVCNRLVTLALTDAGLNPRCTEDPVVAWQLANSEHFDLVLLDVEMPVLNGFELCKRLRATTTYKQTPIIFVTMHSNFENRAKSSLSGGDDLISKPILPMELAAKVVMHLLKRQLKT